MEQSLPGGGVNKVLIIDDEADVIDLLALHFRKQGGIKVLDAADGASGLQTARKEIPDLIILDLMLPAMSGWELCTILKSDPETAGILIIMLTAKAETADRIKGFDIGADDYVVKPFSPHEVLLRSNRILRCAQKETRRPRRTIGPLTIDESRHSVEVNRKPVCLTGAEFRLLTWLVQHPGRIQSRDQLLTGAWGYDKAPFTRTVDTHVRRLRGKLGPAADLIETIRSYGYRFREPDVRY
jgi:two-component system phosphate regulon response regulator PhoB